MTEGDGVPPTQPQESNNPAPEVVPTQIPVIEHDPSVAPEPVAEGSRAQPPNQPPNVNDLGGGEHDDGGDSEGQHNPNDPWEQKTQEALSIIRTSQNAASAPDVSEPTQVTTVKSEEGNAIPVRVVSGYNTYTDEAGKQLATGHDISPGTEKDWGLGDDVEHNPARADEMSGAAQLQRGMAVVERAGAQQERNVGNEDRAINLESSARVSDEHARILENEAGVQYDIDNGLPVSQEKIDQREKELLDTMQVHTDGLKQTIDELKKLKENYPKPPTQETP